MSLQPVLRYSLDLSGNSPNNLVVGEVHTLAPLMPNRSIAPQYGSFYTESLSIRDVGGTIDAVAYSNIPLTGSAPLTIEGTNLGDDSIGFKRVRLSNQDNASENGFYKYQVTGGTYAMTPMALGNLLVPGVDYVPTMLHQDATRVSGKEVCQIIVITNNTLMGDVVLEYQTVGGDYSTSRDALEQLITTLQLDNRPVVWGEIIGLPNGFPPVDHLHHIQDFKGWGDLINVLDDIRSTMVGDYIVNGGGGSGGLTIHVGDTPPAVPQPKQLWWNNETLRMYLYYQDPYGAGTQNVWVEVTGANNVTNNIGGGSGDPVLLYKNFEDITSTEDEDGNPLTYPSFTPLFNTTNNGSDPFEVYFNMSDKNNGNTVSFKIVSFYDAFNMVVINDENNVLAEFPIFFFNSGGETYFYMKNPRERDNIIGWSVNVNDVEFPDDITTSDDPMLYQPTTLLPYKRLMFEEPFLQLLNNLDVNLTQTTDYFNEHRRSYQLDPNPIP